MTSQIRRMTSFMNYFGPIFDIVTFDKHKKWEISGNLINFKFSRITVLVIYNQL